MLSVNLKSKVCIVKGYIILCHTLYTFYLFRKKEYIKENDFSYHRARLHATVQSAGTL